MIDVDHWHNCEDGTAWLVTSQTVNGKPYLPLFPNGHGYTFESLDRPCDGCDGEGFASNEMVMGVDCPDCDGSGRHVFDLEVAWQTEVDAYEQAYRVSVVPGMVLPIVSEVDPVFIAREEFPLITIDVTLPPAATTGLWAVKVRIIDEGEP